MDSYYERPPERLDEGDFEGYEEDEDDVSLDFEDEGRDSPRLLGQRFDADSDDDLDMLDDGSDSDTTAEQARRGMDIQGIPWERLRFTREDYRETRLQQYKNYQNLSIPLEKIDKQECRHVEKGSQFYEFFRNTKSVKSTIVHFQLRNLVWATSKHDIYIMHNCAINHWSPLTQRLTQVLNLHGNPVNYTQYERAPWMFQQGLSRVQISTMCIRDNLIVAGGFHGEMVCKSLDSNNLSYCSKITHDENAITNAIEVFTSSSGTTRLLSSNNDCIVREFDAETFYTLSRQHYPWPVNHTSVTPDGKLVVVVGDDPEAFLADMQSGKVIASLKGHLDYSFATAWHPNGRLFATGNQDMTCRIWDTRYLSSALFALKGRLGAIRSLRFTSDGRFLAMSEPADFVHVFDVNQDFSKCQEVDLFGEIAGISFSPDSEALFVGMADRTYGSLLEFNRIRPHVYMEYY